MLTISWTEGEVLTDDDGNNSLSSADSTLVFDVVTSENHEAASILTEHAVEDGSPLSDHKRSNPRRVTIEAVVSNTPLQAPPPAGEFSLITTRQGKDDAPGTVLQFDREFDRMVEVFNVLERLRVEAVPVTLTTRLRTYDSVQIVSVTSPRNTEDGDSARFSIEIQEPRIARTRNTDAVPVPREPRGAPTEDAGAQAPVEPNQSFLDQARELADANGGGFGGFVRGVTGLFGGGG